MSEAQAQAKPSSKGGKKVNKDAIAKLNAPELPVAVTGPLQREGAVEKLSEIAQNELGIKLKLEKDSGYVVPEEQRQAERRQEELDRRMREEEEQRNADMVAKLTTPQVNGEGSNNDQAAQAEISSDTQTTEEADSGASSQATTDQATAGSDENGEADESAPKVDEAAKNAAIAQIQAMAKQLGVELVPLDQAPHNTARSGRPMKNGISRPGSDTKTGKVWSVADAITAQKQRPATIKELMQAAELRSWADATIRTQYARWRAFNGISGRVQGDDDGGRSAGSEKRLQNELQKVAFPPMLDADFLRYGEMDRNGELPDAYRPWFEQEKARRAPATVPQSTAQMVQTAANGPMADEIYQRMLLLEKNNSLPEALKDALKEEKARRGE